MGKVSLDYSSYDNPLTSNSSIRRAITSMLVSSASARAASFLFVSSSSLDELLDAYTYRCVYNFMVRNAENDEIISILAGGKASKQTHKQTKQTA